MPEVPLTAIIPSLHFTLAIKNIRNAVKKLKENKNVNSFLNSDTDKPNWNNTVNSYLHKSCKMDFFTSDVCFY